MFYLFVSTRDGSVSAMCVNESGDGLPQEYAPWERRGEGMVSAGPDAFPPHVLAAVEGEGYYLFTDRPQTTE